MKLTALAVVVLLAVAGCGGGTKEAPAKPISQNDACAKLVSAGEDSPLSLAVDYYSGFGDSPGHDVPSDDDFDAEVSDLSDLAKRVPDSMRDDVKALVTALKDAYDDDLSGVEDVRAAALSLGKTCADFMP